MSVDTNNAAFQDALNLIQYTRQSVFLTGKAGTGKSTFLRYVCEHTKKKHVVRSHQRRRKYDAQFLQTPLLSVTAGRSEFKSPERTHSRVLQVHQTAPEITGTD